MTKSRKDETATEMAYNSIYNHVLNANDRE